ncbi:hypothetical protein GXY_14607 [Novacetimonas hansenii ATCC 23769]|uniref:Uncharacterized protein n=1 Tax=Novacetimonas hansenii ATCC 23769 TaxID=714995 RepID=D5QIE0_NOVHA|nr:hypothetical protein GXY_14607 [Novacetimonas hansenii ATCC 23769]
MKDAGPIHRGWGTGRLAFVNMRNFLVICFVAVRS